MHLLHCCLTTQFSLSIDFIFSSWFEQNAEDYVRSVRDCLDAVAEELAGKGFKTDQLKGIGITNQRETTVLWDRETGKPFHPALIWSDRRAVDIVKRLIEDTPTKRLNDLRVSQIPPTSVVNSCCYFSVVVDCLLVHTSVL